MVKGLIENIEIETSSGNVFADLSERKLMECLNRLGYDIEINVCPAAEPIGHLTLAIA
ncbi:MAG: hypothetical protein M0Z78_00245 [Betaproteobacteria bacterium]|nr:hypothetical protein [Betaproteobacteria bacterium]